MTMKRILFAVVGVLLVCVATVFAAGEVKKGEVTFDTGSRLNLNGYWAVDGTEVTASAATLNAAGGGTTATITPTLVSNAAMVVYGKQANFTNSVTVGGALTISEGALANSTVLSADIKDGEIVNADINASAAIAVTKLGTGGVIPANSGASLTNLNGEAIADDTIDDDSIDWTDVTSSDMTFDSESVAATALSGNVVVARLTNAIPTFLPAYSSGTIEVIGTALVYVLSDRSVTNVIHADITTE